MFGLGSALASALRKVVDALPDDHRTTASDAAQRILIDPETDLLSRRPATGGGAPTTTMARDPAARCSPDTSCASTTPPQSQPPQWRTVDPIGLVTVRDRVYLLATRCRRRPHLSAVAGAGRRRHFAEPAQRPGGVDLDRVWRDRSTRFRTGGDQVTVLVRVDPARREDLVGTGLAVRTDEVDTDGWLRLEVTFRMSGTPSGRCGSSRRRGGPGPGVVARRLRDRPPPSPPVTNGALSRGRHYP